MSTIPVTDFQIGISGAGKSLSNNNDLDIIFAGDMAMTNGSKMYLPALDQSKSVTQDQALVTRGLVIHESSHIERGDGDAWSRYAETAPALGAAMLNAVEDVRLDAWSLKLLAGAKPALKATCDHMFGTTINQYPKGDPTWNELGMLPAIVAMMGRKMAGIDSHSIEEAMSRISPLVRETAESIVSKALTFHMDKRGTKQSIKLVREFIEDLKRKHEPKPEPKPGGGGDGEGKSKGEAKSGSGSDSESDGKSGTKSDAKPEAKSDAKSESSSGGSSGGDDGSPTEDAEEETTYDMTGEDGEHVVRDSMEDARGGGKGAGSGTSEVTVEAINSEIDKVVPVETKIDLKQVLGDVMVGTHTAYTQATTEYDTVWSRKKRTNRGATPRDHDRKKRAIEALEPTTKGMEVYNTHRANVRGHLGVCQRALENALRSLNRRDWQGGKISGRLDPKAFTAVVSSLSPYAFKGREMGRELNTAVQIVIDLSGSMSGTKAATARDTAIVLSEVLNRLGVPFEVVGFNSLTWAGEMAGIHESVTYEGDGHNKNQKSVVERAKAMISAGAKSVRVDPLDIWVFKDFDDQLRYAQPALGRIPHFVGGNNIDGESIAVCASRLMMRREKRRIMMVLSDGSPAGYTVGPMADSGLYQHLKDVVKDLPRKHIEVIGVGIEDTSVKHFYPKYVTINDASELGGTVMVELGRMLLGQRFNIVGEAA